MSRYQRNWVVGITVFITVSITLAVFSRWLMVTVRKNDMKHCAQWAQVMHLPHRFTPETGCMMLTKKDGWVGATWRAHYQLELSPKHSIPDLGD